MNINEENNKLIRFWNQWFEKAEPKKIVRDDIDSENTLNQYLKEMGDQSSSVLDVGTGSGYCLFVAKWLGNHMSYGLGIDPADKAIEYARKTCQLSNMNHLEFKVGNHQILSSLQDESFDGVICSNVLDVVPEETSNQIIQEITRITRPGGLLVLKLNFYLTKELIDKIKMEEVAEHTYAINGIIRGLNYSIPEWVKKFSEFSLVKSGEYERIKNGPKDRVLMLVKNKLGVMRDV